MNELKRYLWPIAVGGGVLIVALIAIAGWILPEGHKVSNENAQKVTLLAQETSLQTEINALRQEQAQEPKNCSTLRQDRDLVPGTPTVDLFLHQISQLANSSGTQTPNISITDSGTPGSGPSAPGAQTVGISLTVAGSYQQVLSFIEGLNNAKALARLFPVSSLTLSGGSASGGAPTTQQSYSLQLQGNIYYNTTAQDVCQTTPSGKGGQST
jgi:Tfp pilus assembly protein PilO